MSIMTTMTVQEIAKAALELQYAVNLGIVQAWAEMIQVLHQHYPNMSTTEFCRHPVNQLMADKVASLTGSGSAAPDQYHEAHKECVELASGENL